MSRNTRERQDQPVTQAPVTVIVVNWNGGEWVEKCLRCLQWQSVVPQQILLMDNGSSDDSAARAQQIPGVTVRRLGENRGFAAANNQAIAECTTEFIALLNPDAFPEPDWLEALLAAAQANPGAAAFGSRQLMHGRAGVLDGTGDVYHMSGLVWRGGFGRANGGPDDEAADIFSPCAGAALYRREAVLEVGGFDEDYFCYTEDVDLGFRLRLAGYSSRYVPAAIVQHVGSATTGGRRSDFAMYHGHRNLVWTFVKDMPGILFWALLPLHCALNLASIAYFLLRGQGGVILTAKRDAIRGMPAMWRKRRAIQAARDCSIRSIWQVIDKRLWKSA